ncbi:MAG: TonB-dependent receptor [Flavobacteriales bacterium]|jgi:iron complex outermembrane receptor protein
MKHILLVSLFLSLSVQLISQVQAPCYLHGRLLLSSDSSAVQNALVFASQEPITRSSRSENLPNAYSDAEGRFTLAMKGASSYFRIIRTTGDTVDITLETANCNSIRDIFLPSAPNALASFTYVQANVGFILPEVRLEAYRTNHRPEELPAAVGFIDSLTLTQNDRTSLQQALNTIPGVVMESRGYGGSHRLNIRGSSLRSPFAVRNIKLYLDGIPLTSADGQTPLELIDPEDIQQLEVIKGPAGSLYGNGNGGVLLLKSKDIAPNEQRVTSGFQAASYGGYRWNNSASLGFKTSSLRVSHNWQEYGGYREQEFNRKQQVSLLFKQKISESQRMSVFGTYYSGIWGLPGALNEEQAQLNPQSAVPFSIINNASLYRERYVAAITHESSWLNYFKERTILSYQKTNKRNPYGTSAANNGYKDERADAISGRTEWSYKQATNQLSWQVMTGAEWQNEQYSILEQTISNAFPANFKYLYDVGYAQWMGFLTGELIYKKVLTVQGGYSFSHNQQFVRGRNASDFSFDTTTSYGSIALPRIATALQLHEGLFLFHNVARGAANPTVFEMIDQENNSYNLNLKAERGLSQELGIKQYVPVIGLTYSLSVYDFKLEDAILPITLTSGPSAGLQVYDNIGSTHQQGAEWSVQWHIDKLYKQLNARVWNNGTLNRYRFGNYSGNETNLLDQSLPGVPLAQMSSGLSVGTEQWSLSITDYWFDKTPLNNGNTEWSSPYHLLNVYADYTFLITNSWQVQLNTGINNALNSAYTSYYALNGFGGKFYNPAPDRNFFAGLRLYYRFQ